MSTNIKPSFLIVDDAHNWLNYLAGEFLDYYNVVTATNYEDAVHAISIQQPPFPVALIDLRLDPEDSQNVDGLLVATMLKRAYRFSESIILTGKSSPIAEHQALYDHQVFAYLEKANEDGRELDMNKLKNIVQAAIDIHDQKQTLFDPAKTDLFPISSNSNYQASKTVAHSISWLHISDLHIGHTSTDWMRLRKALVDDLRQHTSQESLLGHCAQIPFIPDLLLITGDIAYKAAQSEFEMAGELIREIWSITGLSKERTFFVAGNHDVDRRIVQSSRVFRAAYEALAKPNIGEREWQSDLEDWWKSDELHKFWGEKLESYLAFEKEFSNAKSTNGSYLHSLDISGHQINILGLNSSLMSWKDGEDLERGLWIGQPQLDHLERQMSRQPALSIGLIHHPPEALHHQDRAVWQRLERLCRIILHGHMHEINASSIMSPETRHIRLPGGSIHQDHSWRTQHYSYGQVNLETKQLDLYLRMTRPGLYPIYIRDNYTFPTAAPEGHIRLSL